MHCVVDWHSTDSSVPVLRCAEKVTFVATPAPSLRLAMMGVVRDIVVASPTATQVPVAGQATDENSALVAPPGTPITTRDQTPSLSTSTSGARRVGEVERLAVLPTATQLNPDSQEIATS
jgi:hypothetical protein